MKLIILVGMAALISACATTAQNAYRSMSSGQIGCAENDIQMSDFNKGFINTTWTATCKGKKFYCTNSRGNGFSVASQTSCKEAM